MPDAQSASRTRPRASSVSASPRSDALLDSARALVTPRRFAPEALARTFVIATTDLVEQHLAAGVVGAAFAQAPRVDVTFRPIAPELDDSAAGRVDLVVAPKASPLPGMMRQFLFDDVFLCAVRADHPVVKRRLSLEVFVSLAHVQVTPRGRPGGPVDDALAALGRSRRVAIRTHSFLTAPLLVSRSDLVLTAPARVLRPLADQLGLRLFPPPVELPGFAIHQFWEPRAHADPAHKWFRALVADVARKASA